MTIHQPSTEAQPAPPPRPAEYFPRRLVDQVRSTALANAVELLCRDVDSSAKDVIEVAEMFEAYLEGGESDAP